MKRYFALFLAVILTFSMMGCGKKTEGRSHEGKEKGFFDTKKQEFREGKTLADMAQQISNELEIALPGDLDNTTFEEIVGLKTDEVEEFAGKISMSMESSDNFIAIKAKEDNLDKVKAALEDRLHSVRQSFESYDSEQYAKAKDGKVITKDNYAFLIIVGRHGKTPTDEVGRVEQIIETYFE